MELLKKGTAEWNAKVKASTEYEERLNYKQIKALLEEADSGDCIQVTCLHRHRSNLIAGLNRQGLNHKTDYKLKPSKDAEDCEIILVEKLEVNTAN